jgi:L-serine/L-threonine ammonia-lyase
VQRGLDRIGWSDVKVIGVETEGAGSFAAAKAAGKVVKLDKISTIASSLGALSVTPVVIDPNSPSVRMTESLVVSDQEAVSACVQFANEQKTLVEPACGAAIASVYSQRCAEQVFHVANRGTKDQLRVVVIVCGGSIVNLDLMNQWKMKFTGS